MTQSSGRGADWREINRAHWDEKVAVHTGPGGYDLAELRAGKSRLNAIEEGEIGAVQGQRLLHLQCHFGRDTLILAQRGAMVTGLDFSVPAIDTVRKLAADFGLASRARFVQADLYDARTALSEPASFDRVYVSWGAIIWLPDIVRWAETVAFFLRPGGTLYLAEVHPVALTMSDAAKQPDGRPGLAAPYFGREPVVTRETHDYVDAGTTVRNAVTHSWIHPLGDLVTALVKAGLRLDWLHEHDAITWHMFEHLREGADGQWRWPDRPWLPLSFSLQATRV
ncbi:MAG TPA: methyltransferase domain-containing protein [Magnetospirillaceae bacterium]